MSKKLTIEAERARVDEIARSFNELSSGYLARAEAAERERDEARANYQFMVERAANEKLDGYRELAARVEQAMRERDEARRLAVEAREALGWALCTYARPSARRAVDQAMQQAVDAIPSDWELKP